ncbi:hypothetical protein PbJCM13498_35390 [Prolixibacter bellariivorans]|uniref:Tetratricopeptide repeat protein n=1 Tax=Prolixibacter bellariivorans TaxID=314319 RepID=A0A5M4B466_9BACT|nr:DUF6340 family protein [Prolixibacter bellariivorans]GET34676.1 hypothetical protein PbJCM13498_35390 [Prolixibacter bellariivorans]
MKPKHLLLSILVVFLFSGCYTTNNFGFVDMQVMEPAVVSLPDSVVNLALVDFHRNPVSNGIEFKTNADSVVNCYAATSLKGFESQTDSVQYFHHVAVVHDGLDFFPKGLALPDSVLRSKMSAFCDSMGVQALVGLDTVWISDNSTNKQLVKRVVLGSRWSFFNTLGGSNTYWKIYADTMLWIPNRAEIIAYEKNNRYPKTFVNVLEKYGENNGIRVAMLFVPSWRWTDRLIYYSGNEEMKRADSLVVKNQWEEAAEIWTKMAKSDNKNIEAKATYNMALACEMLGHLELALEWASKSYHVYNNEDHKQKCMDYINILATRLQQQRKLKKQFGG